MKPRACINCGKNTWIGIIGPKKDHRPYTERALDNYCKDCKITAQRTSNAITRKRKEQQAAEQLDRDEISRQRDWL